MRDPAAIDRIPDDLPRAIYGSGTAAGVPPDGTQVFHRTVIEEGMAYSVLIIAKIIARTNTNIRIPDHMARVIYAIGYAGGRGVGGPRKGTEVLYLIVSRCRSGGSSLGLGCPYAHPKEQDHRPYQASSQ
jgi:hypothetical protein